jgi:hypothetical protein
MQTVAFHGQIDKDGKLRIELPVGLPLAPLKAWSWSRKWVEMAAFPSEKTVSLEGILKGILDPRIDVEAEIKEIRAGWKKRLAVTIYRISQGDWFVRGESPTIALMPPS